MASTYSPNLALELIGTGDQAGTWGNTTNTNLGTLIEQAISGYDVQTLTAGTTLTLTIPNGSTGVARNMYLEFTGNGSTVIVPSNKKLYFVYNNCTSGTITMKVAGQTGVAIPKGAKQLLVSDGTDVVPAITQINPPSVTTNNAIVRWDGTNGDAVKNSTITISDAGFLGGVKSQAINTTTTTFGPGNVPIVLNVESAAATANYPVVFKSTNDGYECLLCWHDLTTGTNAFINFGTETAYTNRGSINYNRGAGLVAYNTTSDRRAKTIYGPVTNSGEIIDQLNVYTGKMNWGTDIFPMLLADEAQQVTPYCVTGDPNAVDPQGNPVYQQMDYSALVPLLLAEIQSLRTRVAALEQE
jgi:hypothetical protein